MAEYEMLRPEEAAKRVLEDILTHKEKGETITLTNTRKYDDYTIGSLILNQIYGTPTTYSASDNFDRKFDQKIYAPLNFRPVSVTLRDIPADYKMIEHLGRMIRERQNRSA